MTGNQIRKNRMKLGYSTDKLARKVGVSLSTIQKWERGAQPPNKSNLIRLYAVFNLGHPFKRELTDKQRLEERKRQIELMAKLDAKVDKPRKLGSSLGLDDNDPELIEFQKLMGAKV